MALTATQRSDLQGDLGIGTDQSVFTNDELDRLYARGDSDYNTAVYLAYRQLLADANKLHDYTAGHTSVKKSQVREHIKDMLEFWRDEAKTSNNQLRIVGINSVPPRWKDEPNTIRRKRWKDVPDV